MYLSKNSIEFFFVCGTSTLKQIIIQSTENYSLNQPDTVIHELPSIIKTIAKGKREYDLIAWIIDNPFIKSDALSTDQKLPVNDLTNAYSIYHTNNVNYYDSINQPLLLQIRLISYRLGAYCLCPVSRFFLLMSLYNDSMFKIHNPNNSPSFENLEKFFNYTNVKKTLPFQKNIAQDNYHSYILVYGLLCLYAKE